MTKTGLLKSSFKLPTYESKGPNTSRNMMQRTVIMNSEHSLKTVEFAELDKNSARIPTLNSRSGEFRAPKLNASPFDVRRASSPARYNGAELLPSLFTKNIDTSQQDRNSNKILQRLSQQNFPTKSAGKVKLKEFGKQQKAINRDLGKSIKRLLHDIQPPFVVNDLHQYQQLSMQEVNLRRKDKSMPKKMLNLKLALSPAYAHEVVRKRQQSDRDRAQGSARGKRSAPHIRPTQNSRDSRRSKAESSGVQALVDQEFISLQQQIVQNSSRDKFGRLVQQNARQVVFADSLKASEKRKLEEQKRMQQEANDGRPADLDFNITRSEFARQVKHLYKRGEDKQGSYTEMRKLRDFMDGSAKLGLFDKASRFPHDRKSSSVQPLNRLAMRQKEEAQQKELDELFRQNSMMHSQTSLTERIKSLELSDRKKARLYVYFNQRFGVTEKQLDSLKSNKIANYNIRACQEGHSHDDHHHGKGHSHAMQTVSDDPHQHKSKAGDDGCCHQTQEEKAAEERKLAALSKKAREKLKAERVTQRCEYLKDQNLPRKMHLHYEMSSINLVYKLDLLDALMQGLEDEEIYMKKKQQSLLQRDLKGQKTEDNVIGALQNQLAAMMRKQENKKGPITLQVIQDTAIGCEILVHQTKGKIEMFVSDSDQQSQFLLQDGGSLDKEIEGIQDPTGRPLCTKYFFGNDEKTKQRAKYAKQLDKVCIHDESKNMEVKRSGMGGGTPLLGQRNPMQPRRTHGDGWGEFGFGLGNAKVDPDAEPHQDLGNSVRLFITIRALTDNCHFTLGIRPIRAKWHRVPIILGQMQRDELMRQEQDRLKAEHAATEKHKGNADKQNAMKYSRRKSKFLDKIESSTKSDGGDSEHDDYGKGGLKRAQRATGMFTSLMDLEQRKLNERRIDEAWARLEASDLKKQKTRDRLNARKMMRKSGQKIDIESSDTDTSDDDDTKQQKISIMIGQARTKHRQEKDALVARRKEQIARRAEAEMLEFKVKALSKNNVKIRGMILEQIQAHVRKVRTEKARLWAWTMHLTVRAFLQALQYGFQKRRSVVRVANGERNLMRFSRLWVNRRLRKHASPKLLGIICPINPKSRQMAKYKLLIREANKFAKNQAKLLGVPTPEREPTKVQMLHCWYRDQNLRLIQLANWHRTVHSFTVFGTHMFRDVFMERAKETFGLFYKDQAARLGIEHLAYRLRKTVEVVIQAQFHFRTSLKLYRQKLALRAITWDKKFGKFRTLQMNEVFHLKLEQDARNGGAQAAFNVLSNGIMGGIENFDNLFLTKMMLQKLLDERKSRFNDYQKNKKNLKKMNLSKDLTEEIDKFLNTRKKIDQDINDAIQVLTAAIHHVVKVGKGRTRRRRRANEKNPATEDILARVKKNWDFDGWFAQWDRIGAEDMRRDQAMRSSGSLQRQNTKGSAGSKPGKRASSFEKNEAQQNQKKGRKQSRNLLMGMLKETDKEFSVQVVEVRAAEMSYEASQRELAKNRRISYVELQLNDGNEGRSDSTIDKLTKRFVDQNQTAESRDTKQFIEPVSAGYRSAKSNGSSDSEKLVKRMKMQETEKADLRQRRISRRSSMMSNSFDIVEQNSHGFGDLMVKKRKTDLKPIKEALEQSRKQSPAQPQQYPVREHMRNVSNKLPIVSHDKPFRIRRMSQDERGSGIAAWESSSPMKNDRATVRMGTFSMRSGSVDLKSPQKLSTPKRMREGERFPGVLSSEAKKSIMSSMSSGSRKEQVAASNKLRKAISPTRRTVFANLDHKYNLAKYTFWRKILQGEPIPELRYYQMDDY